MAGTVKQPPGRKYNAYHAHGCLQCGRRYMDDCKDVKENGTCYTCKTGHPTPLWERNRWPAHCCKTMCKPVTDVVILNGYSLAGPGPWWQCRACKRTHPFDPAVFTPTGVNA